jgi:hypothetical protein
LCSAPILFEQIYSNLASCICALRSTFAFSPRFWVRSTLYTLRPTFMKSTPGFDNTNELEKRLSAETRCLIYKAHLGH